MGNTFENGKLTGVVGILSALVFIVALFATMFTTKGYDIGTSSIGGLFQEDLLKYGSIAAGILGVVFGVLAAVLKAGPKTFIGNVRGALIALAAVALIAFVVFKGDEEAYLWIFTALVLLAAVSDAAYNWVVDQKVLLVISVMLLIILAIAAYVRFGTTDNAIGGLILAAFAALWVIVVAAMFFAPVEVEEPVKKKAKSPSDSGKKNGPVARPYQAKAEQKKAEPKKEEAKKAEPKKVEPKKEEAKKAEPKKEEAKLKVMSSRDANAARSTVVRKESPVPEPEPVAEPVKAAEPEPAPEPEPVAVPVKAAEPEPAPEPEPISAPAAEPEDEYAVTDEGSDDEYADFEIVEDTPEALVRRAAWNKKLRCRRDYGPYHIPIAFVRGKVAVYVESETGDTSSDGILRDEGWTIFRYLDSDVTDGKQQGEEISKAVKDSLKAERAKKKPKK
ncbi:MAG: hypothetical protein LBS92_07045 [Candidatus Methanoplasma sp.]|jgi:colicin import membrane protein|nr:hypothetical protein [Candidatus Methanoplasma sp.]